MEQLAFFISHISKTLLHKSKNIGYINELTEGGLEFELQWEMELRYLKLAFIQIKLKLWN